MVALDLGKGVAIKTQEQHEKLHMFTYQWYVFAVRNTN